MTFDELFQKICEALPGASFGEDNDGQIVIYTNLREVGAGEQLAEFTCSE